MRNLNIHFLTISRQNRKNSNSIIGITLLIQIQQYIGVRMMTAALWPSKWHVLSAVYLVCGCFACNVLIQKIVNFNFFFLISPHLNSKSSPTVSPTLSYHRHQLSYPTPVSHSSLQLLSAILISNSCLPHWDV